MNLFVSFELDELVNLALYTITGIHVRPEEAVCNKQATSMSRGKRILSRGHTISFL